ncbi:transducin beta-like protein 2 isoform X4 [Tribolium castaneum]|uniref:transducin beta-like protein 2 isoform X4 n=1 Tax=Tribolium castaneum TaxID=7070 RepID=UPI0030FEB21D
MEKMIAGFLSSPSVLVAIFLGGSVLLLFYILKLFKIEHEEQHQNEPASGPKRDPVAKSKKKPTWNRADKPQNFTNPWLLKTLKSHTGQVLNIDYSASGKYLASCAEDRAVILWDSKDLAQKDVKNLRVNVEFDHPTFVKWSPDSKAFIIQKHNENAIEVYKIEKKKDGWLGHATKALTFPKAHETDVIGMGIASNGRYIMSCSNKTDLVIWDLKGQILAQTDTYLMTTTCAKISPCGKFVVASGFAPDARVWEVIFSKSGEFQEIKRVFDLTGHSSGVYDVAFDADSSHMATVSKDGTWKLFDTKIEYKKGEDPRLKITGKYNQVGNYSLIGLSPNAEVVAIASGDSLAFYSTLTGHHDYTIDNIYAGRITSLLFDAMGKYVLTTGDKYIRVFHNVTGYRCTIQTSKEKLKSNQTSATKERLEKIITECETFLKSIENK